MLGCVGVPMWKTTWRTFLKIDNVVPAMGIASTSLDCYEVISRCAMRTLTFGLKSKKWWTTVNTTSERKSKTTGGTSQFFVLL